MLNSTEYMIARQIPRLSYEGTGPRWNLEEVLSYSTIPTRNMYIEIP
jgi:hypothetical protein